MGLIERLGAPGGSRSFGLFIASQRSPRRCTLSQNSGLLPDTRARIGAVAAVTLRPPLQSSLL